MGKRLADADSRRFFEEFASVRVSRFRADGTIDPTKQQAAIPFPDGSTKLIGVKHTWFPRGGGWSWFLCPKCFRRTPKLFLIDERPLCTRCCDAMNIKHGSRYGFGRNARRKAQDRLLDELIAKVETNTPLRLKPTPAHWRGRTGIVYNSQRLRQAMRRRLISLRLHQLGEQQATSRANEDDVLTTRRPTPEASALIDLMPIWRANSSETLAQALDKAQATILTALESNDPQQRINAAKLLMRTKQARDRGLI
jgi:hypothetical protein